MRDRAGNALKRIDDVDSRDVIGAVAGEGVENALRVADMARTLDDVHDAAKTANKVNRLRKRLK